MPPLPGEEALLTVFADIHYYFTAPTPKPLHHRFDKGSYVYIYHDAAQNKARLEIANNPGTPDQDAFHGGLSHVHIQHSTQFPTLCTLTVDGLGGLPPQQSSQYEWRLPSADQRNGEPDLLRLHTLDIYFWTQEDSTDFLDTASRLLASSQVETDRGAPTEHPDQQMSTVVRQLEDVAVSDPAYQNGQTPDSRSNPAVAPTPAHQGQQVPSFPPPPSSAPTEQQPENVLNQAQPEQTPEPANTAPLPYNPAAPAAPEPIKHREKTPPPEDGAEGTGLMAAAAADQGAPYTPPHQVGGGVGVPAFAPPPTAPTGYASPPPSAGLTHSNSFSNHKSIQSPPVSSPGLQSPGLQSPVLPSYQQSFLTGQQYPQSAAGTMSFAPPPQDPNAHSFAQAQGQHVYGAPLSPPQHAGQPGLIGGYSNYSYDQTHAAQPTGSEYAVHSQVYRPTEAEAGSHAQKYAQKAMMNPGQRPRKLEENAGRLESGVNRFLKKLEKKI